MGSVETVWFLDLGDFVALVAVLESVLELVDPKMLIPFVCQTHSESFAKGLG